MSELINKWKRATATAKPKHDNRLGRLLTERDKCTTGAIRLIRRGAISRAGIALESKRLGDLGNPELLAQMQAKHLARQREISQYVYEFVADEELQISVEKSLSKLDFNAAPRPS